MINLASLNFRALFKDLSGFRIYFINLYKVVVCFPRRLQCLVWTVHY